MATPVVCPERDRHAFGVSAAIRVAADAAVVLAHIHVVIGLVEREAAWVRRGGAICSAGEDPRRGVSEDRLRVVVADPDAASGIDGRPADVLRHACGIGGVDREVAAEGGPGGIEAGDLPGPARAGEVELAVGAIDAHTGVGPPSFDGDREVAGQRRERGGSGGGIEAVDPRRAGVVLDVEVMGVLVDGDRPDLIREGRPRRSIHAEAGCLDGVDEGGRCRRDGEDQRDEGGDGDYDREAPRAAHGEVAAQSNRQCHRASHRSPSLVPWSSAVGPDPLCESPAPGGWPISFSYLSRPPEWPLLSAPPQAAVMRTQTDQDVKPVFLVARTAVIQSGFVMRFPLQRSVHSRPEKESATYRKKNNVVL